MKKECCSIKVSATDKGCCFKAEGEEVKSKEKEVMENYCSRESMRNRFRSCCSSGK